jgi:hypothetical protein
MNTEGFDVAVTRPVTSYRTERAMFTIQPSASACLAENQPAPDGVDSPAVACWRASVPSNRRAQSSVYGLKQDQQAALPIEWGTR